MKEELAKPKTKISVQASMALEKAGKDFAKKRAWGMAPEEDAPTDFEKLIKAEKAA